MFKFFFNLEKKFMGQWGQDLTTTCCKNEYKSGLVVNKADSQNTVYEQLWAKLLNLARITFREMQLRSTEDHPGPEHSEVLLLDLSG